MDTIETSGSRTPLGDVTNTIGGGQNASNTTSQLIDPKECKRAREQARYASMSLEQRNEKAKKRRESRQRKKDGGPSQPHNVSEGIVESCDKYQPQIQDAKERKRQREKARYAAMSNEQKMEKNKKRREARKRKKDGNAALNDVNVDLDKNNVDNKNIHVQLPDNGCILEPCSDISLDVGTDGNAALNDENVDLDENNDWLHRNESYQPHSIDSENIHVQLPDSGGILEPCSNISMDIGLGHNDGVSPTSPFDNPKKERASRSIYKSEWYKKLTPTAKKARTEQQRLHNKTPGRKVAKRESKKRNKELHVR